MTNFIDGWLPLKLAWKPTQPDKNVSVTVKVPTCQLALGRRRMLWTYCAEEMVLSWKPSSSASSHFPVQEAGFADLAVEHR